jgi:hypothetical protein
MVLFYERRKIMYRRLAFIICFVSALSIAGSASAELVARYTFDDLTAADSAQYYENADGTFYGDAHVIYDDEGGPCLKLDGNEDYVRMDPHVTEFGASSFTYTMWVKTRYVDSYFYLWKGRDYAGDDGDDLHGISLYHDDSSEIRFTLYAYTPGTKKVRTNVADTNAITGEWTLMACVRDAEAGATGELSFYINAELEPPVEGTNPIADTVGNISNDGWLWIGCNDRAWPDPEPSGFYGGLIDDVRGYNHALSRHDIELLFLGLPDPNLAHDPSPGDGATDECTNVVLSWTEGQSALSHDIYFGTDGHSVRSATTSDGAIFRLNQDGNTYDAGALESLQEGETYFWRVDEVGSGGQKWKGDVWKFRVNDGKAHSPDPRDNSTKAPLDQVLSWSAGCYAVSHRVYFGTNFNDVNDATTSSADVYKGQKSLAETEYDPNGLDYSVDYYWRIDEVNGVSKWKGNTWSFRSIGKVFDPNLRVWYTLDETDGNTANDSSGRDYHGTLDLEEGVIGWDPDGRWDRCLKLDDDGHVMVPPDVLLDIDKEITVSVWLNNAVSSGDNTCFQAGADWEDHLLTIAVPDDDADITWRAGDDVNDLLQLRGANPRSWQGSWNHFAFKKDENDANMYVYLNGELVAERGETSTDAMANVAGRPIRIGAKTNEDSDYLGKIDDFKIYDRALSTEEIEEIFRGGNVADAWAPKPSDGEVDVPRDTNLSWRAGNYAVTHDLFFGTNFDDVNNATTASSGIYKGPKNLGDESHDLPILDLSKTYYWRVDEVNTAEANSPWTGKVWSFTVANFLVVDDMEDYDDDVIVPQNPINETWIDGWINYTGSTVYLEYGPRSIVHRGLKAMELEYDNNWPNPAVEKYSEVYANVATGDKNLGFTKNWTEVDVKALTLFFYGDPNNDVEPLYVMLEDTSEANYVSNYGDLGQDLNDVAVSEWHQWDMELAEFNDNGVDITDVNKIYMGLGDRDNPVAGGSGHLYIDNIRLYLSRCVPSLDKPPYDFSNNCVVDFADIQAVAREWLKSDFDVSPVTAPNSPVLHYAFEDSDGNSIEDSANDYDGLFFIDVNQTAGDIGGRLDPNGKSGNSFHFQSDDAGDLGYAGIKIPSAVFSTISQDVTVSVWVKNLHTDEEPDSGACMWEFRQWDGVSADANDRVLAVAVEDSGDQYIFHDQSGKVAYDHDWDGHTGWEHYAFVRTDSNLAIYVNGILEGIADSNGTPLATPQLLYLGISADEAPGGPDVLHDGFTGNIDEFKIFNYALPRDQVAWIASDGLGTFRMESAVNIYDKELLIQAVNFRDYAVLVDTWLDEVLWP